MRTDRLPRGVGGRIPVTAVAYARSHRRASCGPGRSRRRRSRSASHASHIQGSHAAIGEAVVANEDVSSRGTSCVMLQSSSLMCWVSTVAGMRLSVARRTAAAGKVSIRVRPGSRRQDTCAHQVPSPRWVHKQGVGAGRGRVWVEVGAWIMSSRALTGPTTPSGRPVNPEVPRLSADGRWRAPTGGRGTSGSSCRRTAGSGCEFKLAAWLVWHCSSACSERWGRWPVRGG